MSHVVVGSTVTSAVRLNGMCSGHVIEELSLLQSECEAACEATDGCVSYGYSIDGCYPRDHTCDDPASPDYGAFEYILGLGEHV